MTHPRVWLALSASLALVAPAAAQQGQGGRFGLAQALDPEAPRPAEPADRPTLTEAQIEAVGRKIWQNEGGGKVEALTHWNEGEEFPSLGIGHFIWFPRGFDGPFTESFPALIRFAESRGARGIPAVARSPHSPWRSRAEFEAAFDEPELAELRRWLADHVALQTEFIMRRSAGALDAILAAAPPADRARIQANYHKVASTPQGAYALIDYVNFKGEGTNPAERYQGQGWGLLDVLQRMDDVPAGPDAAREFASAAIQVLDRRIANSPPERGEQRWAKGWHNRCRTYAQPFGE